MKKAVLDASAVIAFVKRERGHEIVREWISGSVLSAVNYAEVLQTLGKTSGNRNLIEATLSNLRVSVADFDADHARNVAELYAIANKGISLADRACMAVGRTLDLPIVTGDHKWSELELNHELIIFRPRNN
ncbi:MAG: type II toxin-antitoxin system VapC family toxin [Planctomycetota bacterium]